MASITRSQYRNAILAGIGAVSPEALAGPTADDILALLKMADTDKEFGTNYASKPVACPMGRLGYYNAEEARTTNEWASTFAMAFDSAWISLVPSDWHARGETVRVTD